MLRLIRRDPKRPADVVVDRNAVEPVTARAVPHPFSDADPPSSTELALEPLNEAVETVHTGELLLEPYADATASEATPVTGISPWQRLVPPHLPESEP